MISVTHGIVGLRLLDMRSNKNNQMTYLNHVMIFLNRCSVTRQKERYLIHCLVFLQFKLAIFCSPLEKLISMKMANSGAIFMEENIDIIIYHIQYRIRS